MGATLSAEQVLANHRAEQDLLNREYVPQLINEIERLQSENTALRNDVTAAMSQDGGESLLRTVTELRDQNSKLHRRCQQAEASVTEAMRQWEQHGGPRGGSFLGSGCRE